LVQSLQQQSEAGSGSNRLALQSIGLPACKGFLAFAQGKYSEAVEHLLPVRHRSFHFGGSHAQRDILNWTTIEAMLRAGQYSRARTALNERLELKPGSPQSWGMAARAYDGLGLVGKSAAARDEADRLLA